MSATSDHHAEHHLSHSHQYHSGHHGHIGHSHNYTEANKHHFNSTIAQQCDGHPDAIEFARRLAAAMLKAYPFTEESTTVMDYACGTGLISRELAAYTQSIVGVDISQPMVDQFNFRVANQGISPDEMKAVCVELRGQEGELHGAKFDVIVCASAYHHVNSIHDLTRTLAFFLKPGGVLLVADVMMLDTSDAIFPDEVAHIVPHRAGFTKEDIGKAFAEAALDFSSFEKVFDAKHHGQSVEFFLAKGIKNNG